VAHSKSALKRIRQNHKRRLRNRSIKSKVNTLLKKTEYAIKNNQNEDAEKTLKSFYSIIDKAVKKKIFHKNNASHKKSKLTKKLNLITQNKE